MAIVLDAKGTSYNSFQIQKNGVKLLNTDGTLLEILNSAGMAGDIKVENASAAALKLRSGANTITVQSGALTSDLALTLPADAGSNGYILSTDGNGLLSWASPGAPPEVADKATTKSTSITFGSDNTVAMFTLPANAIVRKVQVIVDTAFDGTPLLTVGILGTLDKYMASSANDLTSGNGDLWEVNPTHQASGSSENIIATLSSLGTVGAGRILVDYVIPS